MPKDTPLWYKLYFHPPYYELARLIGYEGLPAPEVLRQARPLVERYGKDRMNEASRDLVRIDSRTDPPTARLTEEARRLCRQLLGPPPDTAAEGVA